MSYKRVADMHIPSVLFGSDDVSVSALTALSSDEPRDEDVLDAGCLLDVLRLYRWHISSFEEQVSHLCF